MKYDIFISYRRDGGAQYARILQLMLAQRGYKVFLDYDELTDGIFKENIKAAIKDAPIFMLVLSRNSLDRCVNKDDMVRQEILLATSLGKHIIPVNPDNKFEEVPETCPEDIRDIVASHQHSEVLFGQTLGVTIDFMIEKRIAPKIGVRQSSSRVDTDFDAAKVSLKKQDAHNRFMKRLGIFGTAAALLIVIGACIWFWQDRKERDNLSDLRTEIEHNFNQYELKLSPTLTRVQLQAIRQILDEMTVVKDDSLWISRFEFTEGLWRGVLNEDCEEELRNMPKANVSFGEIGMFLDTLRTLTGTEYAKVEFDLPSAEEWEYAARGGKNQSQTTYAGSNDINEVGWFAGNSGGVPHPSDGQQEKKPNMLSLFDMSGNVSEWCFTPFDIGLEDAKWTVCGGNYTSPATEVTVSSRAGFSTNAKAATVGFRLAIRKKDF